MSTRVHVLDHPLAQHFMARLRDQDTEPALFRSVTRQLTTLLTVQATCGLRTRVRTLETPLERTDVQVLDERLVVVPILRAGLGMLESVVNLLGEVSVGYLGLERDEVTAEASAYYSKLPEIEGRRVLVVDPMLATGGSACQALHGIVEGRPSKVAMICVVAAPEGVRRVNEEHPDVEIHTAALDRELDERKYILPGLGDFGDRLYGTT
jgi:uracil phosphoribosyltransferase